VTFDRGDVIGKGGEASVYRGNFNGQRVVVREVVMPRSSWGLPAGQKIVRVIAICSINVISVHLYLQLIHREVITHAQLDHPNILRFLGVLYDSTEAPPMMVLPLVEKGALADLIITKVIAGVEYAWIVCFAAPVCKMMASRHFTQRLLESVAL
jgi:serine/threonine protein kinase